MNLDAPGAETSPTSFVDKLTIETPEQTPLDFTIAGVGSRFLPLLVDTLIETAFAVLAVIFGVIGGRALRSRWSVAPTWVTAIILLLLFVLYFGYFAIFEIVWNGQTPGKRLFGIRAIKDSGRPLTPAEVIGRNLMRIVDWMPGFYAAGIICVLITKENQRLGDLVAGSIVVRESSLGDLKTAAWEAASAEALPDPTLVALGANRLSAEESAIIDSFMSRRASLDSIVRYRIADEIVRRLTPKLTIPAGNTRSSEKILEALAYERRVTGRYS